MRIITMLVMIATALAGIAQCQVINPATGSTYQLTSSATDVRSARIEADLLGGHLTTINDAAENAFVVAFLNAENPITDDFRFWIGFSDEQTEGNWMWDDGSDSIFTNWIPSEPSASNPDEDYAIIQPTNPTLAGGWGDHIGTPQVLLYGVIEIPGGSVCGDSLPAGINYSLNFANGQWVRVPDHPSLDGFNDFTIEFWVKSLATATRHIMTKGATSSGTQTDDSFGIVMNFSGCPTGTIWVELYEPDSQFSLCSTTAVNDGSWHHVAVTRSMSQVGIFVDGYLDSSGTYAPQLGTSHNPLAIGSLLFADGTPASTFDGQLDEIRVWNVHRSESEIQATKDRTIASSEPGLVGYWRLDDAPNQIIEDHSPLDNDGTLGESIAVMLDDPEYHGLAAAPLPYCSVTGEGQANTAHATLLVNNTATGSATGPFQSTLIAGEPFSVTLHGDPYQPYSLFAALAISPNPVSISGFGNIDIGLLPDFTDIVVILDGFEGIGALLYSFDASGSSEHSFNLPPWVSPGPLIAIQAIARLGNPGPLDFWIRPTAAHTLTVL